MGLVLTAIGYVAGYLAILFFAICIGTCGPGCRLTLGWAATNPGRRPGVSKPWISAYIRRDCPDHLHTHTHTPQIHTACGLYYAAELAEEYASATKKLIAWSIFTVIAMHFALIVEKFPLPLLAGGVACHAVYGCLLLDFPNVEVFSLKFGLSLCKWWLGFGLWDGMGRRIFGILGGWVGGTIIAVINHHIYTHTGG